MDKIAGAPYGAVSSQNPTKQYHLSMTTVVLNAFTLIAFAASGHRVDGSAIPGGWHNNPEMGSGGSLWSTPTDMAKFYIDLMLTYMGHSETIITRQMTVEMLTPQIEDRGLGPWVIDDGSDLFYFGHPGHTDGYKSYVVMYPKRGQGLVIMTNSDAGNALYYEILNSVTSEYGWAKSYTALSIVILFILIIGIVMFLIWRKKG